VSANQYGEPWASTFESDEQESYSVICRLYGSDPLGLKLHSEGRMRYYDPPDEIQAFNARHAALGDRIVACVNACAGVPTEMLREYGEGLFVDNRLAALQDYLLIVDRDGDPWGCFREGHLPTTVESLLANADLQHPDLAPHRVVNAKGGV
jgi:hypothetical protein